MIYSIKANVYTKKLGPMFGRTTRTTIEAKDDNEAKELATKNFENYCAALKKHHSGDFEFNDVGFEQITPTSGEGCC